MSRKKWKFNTALETLLLYSLGWNRHTRPVCCLCRKILASLDRTRDDGLQSIANRRPASTGCLVELHVPAGNVAAATGAVGNIPLRGAFATWTRIAATLCRRELAAPPLPYLQFELRGRARSIGHHPFGFDLHNTVRPEGEKREREKTMQA